MVFDKDNKKLRDLYKREKAYKNALANFSKREDIPEEDKKLIFKFLDDCKRGATGKRRNAEIGELRLKKLLSWVGAIRVWYGKPFKERDEKAFKTFLQKLDEDKILKNDGKPYSHNTKLDVKKICLKFWKWLSQQYKDERYFAMVDNNVKYKRKELDPDAFTKKQIWDLCEDLPLVYEFIVKMGFDGGFRTTELWNLRRRDVLRKEHENDYYFQANVRIDTSKTKGRTVSLRLSTDIIERYLKAHPDIDKNPNAFLIKKTIEAVRKQLRRIGKEKLGQSLTFLLLRHSSMTYYAPRIKNATLLEQRYGEVAGSKAIRHYIAKSGILEEEVAEAVKHDEITKVHKKLKNIENEKSLVQEELTFMRKQAEKQKQELEKFKDYVERLKPFNDVIDKLSDSPEFVELLKKK